MEESHSLFLNEEALGHCPEPKKPLFIYEWLRYLDRILPVTNRSDLKSMQPRLISQLEARLCVGAGPPTRNLLAKCIAKVYATGDPYAMFGTINVCNDIIKSKDDSPAHLPIKLSALACLSSLYESVGRLVGASHEESFHNMIKWLKSAESQGRSEILCTMSKMVRGLGSGGSKIHKEMYKVVRAYVTDRVLYVRISALQCLSALVHEYVPLYTTELEAMVTTCVKALDGSTYDCRIAVAQLLATLLSHAHVPPPDKTLLGKGQGPVHVRPMATDECLSLLAAAFLRGGIGGFLKGGSSSSASVSGQREVRVGIALGYVEFVREMGSSWLERNLAVFTRHTLDLAAKCGPLAYTNQSSQLNEAVQLRRCVSFILRSTVGTLLSENAQIVACRHLGQLLADYINSFDYSLDPGMECSLGADAYTSALAAQVALLELSVLVRQIGTAVTPLFVEASGIMESVFACLLHPVLSARVSTAWCLRCVTIAVPSLLTPLIDRCISRLEHMKACADAISGYSLALSSLIAGRADSNLGIPNNKYSQVIQVAESMLRTSTQTSSLAIAKINAGWMLFHALVSLGPAVMKDEIHRIVPLWKAAFPRSVKEAEAEKNRGDAFSWQCALESRAGALCVMGAVAEQKDLLEDSIIQNMISPIECSLVMMAQVGALIRSFGSKIRPLIAVVRVRVYALLALLNPKCYETLFAPLLRELVADITLSDNSNSTQATTLADTVCSGVESALLCPWTDATDHSMLENTMSPVMFNCVGAPEFDTTTVITECPSDISSLWPEPFPSHIQAVDSAVLAYGRLFPLVPSKHKLQITEHFAEVIKSCKTPARQSAIQLNVLCAVVTALRTLSEQKNVKGNSEQLNKTTLALILPGLSTAMPATRCLAAECLGRLAQTNSDPQFVASMAQFCFDKLKAQRDGNSRSGFSLALGCLHRHVGSLGSGQHLNTGVGVLLALAQDTGSSVVQLWSLVSLSLIAETGGDGMFRGFVEPVLSVCVQLLLNTSAHSPDVVQCIGKLLSALITCVGPELSLSGLIDPVRSSLNAACALQLAHPDPLVKTEGIMGLQQLHLFAPRHVNLAHLVVDIASLLSCPHLCLRRAAVSCLRQLVQREAREVREHAQVLVPQGIVDEGKKLPLPDTGLEGALFGMLDVETDPMLRTSIKETLISLVQATSGELLNQWLCLCKELLASSTTETTTRSTLIVDDSKEKKDNDEEEGGDDDVSLAGPRSGAVDKGKVSPRWPTRVFATQIVQRLMSVCDTERAHLDLALAKELQMSSGGRSDYVVLHLADLVRMSFMGATSDSTQLRLAGLDSLQDVITRFSAVPEPEFPGHVILEQFQAQVGAALRPAFSEDTPSHVTAAACRVCSTWIGSGVARDLNDLRRVHQLLVSSLGKLRHGSVNTQLYSESAATLEQLSILKAWAEVYVTAVVQKENSKHRKDDDDTYSPHESLLSLVEPELQHLVEYWLAALRDAALLSLPSPLSEQIPTDGGAFFNIRSVEVCREYYRGCWPPILLAVSIWMRNNNFTLPTRGQCIDVWGDERTESRFSVMLGLATDALSSRTAYSDDTSIQQCVRGLATLLQCETVKVQLMSDVNTAIELCYVLHRLVLTRDSLSTQQCCIDCALAIMEAAKSAISLTQTSDVENGNVSRPSDLPDSLFEGNEGSEEGIPTTSLTFAFLELALCAIVRQIPQINSAQMKSRSMAPLHARKAGRVPPEGIILIKGAVRLLVQVPSLCSPPARIPCLSVVLYLLTGLLRESARREEGNIAPEVPTGHLTQTATIALHGLRTVSSAVPSGSTLPQWSTVMRSALYSLLLVAEEQTCVDLCVILVGCAVLATGCPKSILLGHKLSFHKFTVLVRDLLASEQTPVVVKTIQSVSSLLSRKEVFSPLVKHVGPSILSILAPYMSRNQGASKCMQISEDELSVVLECMKTFELLTGLAPTSKKLSMLNLVVQSACSFLHATSSDQWRTLSPSARRLQEAAVNTLNSLALQYKEHFRTVLNAHPPMKSRLEAALLFQSSRVSSAQMIAAKKAAEQAKASTTTVQPTIRLTLDFNSFGKATAAE